MHNDEGSSEFPQRFLASRNSKQRKTLKLEQHARKRLPGLGQRLMRKLEVFRALMEKKGIRLRVEPSDYARDLYFRLGIGFQKRLGDHFSSYVDLVYDLDRKGIDIRDSRRLLWAFLRRNSLQPSIETFFELKDWHVIEIYSRDNVQIFRDLKFLELCDCSVFDLLVLDWMTVFKREAELEERLFLQIESSFRKASKVYPIEGVAQHRFRYRFDDDSRETTTAPRLLSPLINRKKKRRSVDAILLASEFSLENIERYSGLKIIKA